MRQAKSRKNFATGTANHHATFSSLFNSVRDYFERQKYFKVPNGTAEEYISGTVKSNYAEDGAYFQKWRNIYQNVSVSPVIRYSGYFITLVVAAACLYALYAMVRNSNLRKKKIS